ncbi:MAG: DNA repair protein RadA [Thermodesulfobacteriota bacterium]
MKQDVIFVCSSCGKELLKWMGRCPGCGEWNTIQETRSRAETPRVRFRATEDRPPGVVSLAEIPEEVAPRVHSGIGELDRVLGGGIVNRSLILVGGDPGIGKSTLLMQALGGMASRGDKALYISGEESAEQIRLRAARLGIESGNFLLLVENELEPILDAMERTDHRVVVLDSVQAICGKGLNALAGSVSQVRHVAARIQDLTKKGSSACFLVGHVTKDGMLAGPKVLEHMVDTVLYFEGERGHPYRILRAVKNRFGSSSEIGVFEMGDAGLSEVVNPSELFLSERPQGVSGSTVTSLVEGSRPILAEIQALVTGPVPGQGRRTCLGTDSQRLALMIAVMEKKLRLPLGDQDIFLNAVGGIRATEPATDLAVAAAILSSYVDKPVPAQTMVFGEVGLAGEVRRVSRASARLAEAVRLGFTRIVGPAVSLEKPRSADEVERRGIAHISELGGVLFGK